MGQGCSDFDSNTYDLRLPGLYLKRYEVNQLSEIFNKIDVDHSESIKLRELFAHIKLEPTPFSIRAFKLVDKDNSGTLDFREFVLTVWNFCSLDSDSFGRFSYF